MKNYKAYIFDMDLTLLDTIDTAIKSYDACFKICGATFDKNSVTHHLAIPLDASYKEITNPTKPYEAFLKEFKRVADETFISASIYEDGLEILKYLHDNNKLLGIVTNRDFYSVSLALKNAGVFELFSSIITCDKVSKLKPDPEPMNTCLKELGITKNEAIYVGDAKNDFMSAKNAGMDFVAVERYNNCNFDCDVKINNLNELKNIE